MSNKLYIGNLSYNTTENDLTDLLSGFGALVSVNLIRDRFSGNSKGFAFAEFEDSDAMNKAMSELDGNDFQGRPLRVNEAQDRKPPRRDDRGGGHRRDNRREQRRERW